MFGGRRGEILLGAGTFRFRGGWRIVFVLVQNGLEALMLKDAANYALDVKGQCFVLVFQIPDFSFELAHMVRFGFGVHGFQLVGQGAQVVS